MYLQKFSPPGSRIIQVFRTKHYGNIPLTRVSTSISLHRVLPTLRPSDVINTVLPDRGKLVTLIVAGSSTRRSLLMAGDGRRIVYDNKRQRCGEDNTQNSI